MPASSLLIAPAALPRLRQHTVATASAAACPDVEVIFARGRQEAAGAGQIGNAFVSALRQQDRQERLALRGELPRRHRDRHRRQRHEPARPEHHRQLPGHPDWSSAATRWAPRSPMWCWPCRCRCSRSRSRCRRTPSNTSPRSPCSATESSGSGRSRASTRSTSERTIELCHGDDPICNPTDPDNWEVVLA